MDPVFAKTSPERSFSMNESELFGLVFAKTGPIKFGHWGLEIFTLDFRKCVFGTSKEVTSFTEYGSMELFTCISLNMVPWSDFFH